MSEYFGSGEIVETMADLAKVLGVSVMTAYRYRRAHPVDFPKPPTFRLVVLNWATEHPIPKRRGPEPGVMADRVAELRAEGLSFAQIGRSLSISKQAAWRHWRRREAEVTRY